MPNSSVYSKTITIPYTAIDENGHVNNVTYVQWMQDIAVEHYSSKRLFTIRRKGKFS